MEQGLSFDEAIAAFLAHVGVARTGEEGRLSWDLVDHAVLDTFSPLAVVVDRRLTVRRSYRLPEVEGLEATLRAGDPTTWRAELASAVELARVEGTPQVLAICDFEIGSTVYSTEVSVTPIGDPRAAEPLSIVSFAHPDHNHGALERTQHVLREQTAFLEAVVENIPNMLFIKEAEELRFVRFNRAGEKLLGFARDDLIGKNDYDFFPPDEADFFTSKDRAVLASGELLDIPEEPIHTATGTRYLHTRKVPLLNPETGEPVFCWRGDRSW